MANHESDQPETPPADEAPELQRDERQQRLAAALRGNLRRRKAQARARRGADGDGPDSGSGPGDGAE